MPANKLTAVVVDTVAAVTSKVPVFVAKSAVLVAALTVNTVLPPGVAAVVEIVSVDVLKLSAGTKLTGFGENNAVVPVGSAVVTLRVAVKAPALPGPVPRLTVTV